ncbi:MAG: HlyD family efflux transporter periplasmic adaptor subunit [Pseudomonadota bacterium]|nr:HlyD family efflux transporter periplasmic adaptor subunit [Pseudomonadota bacterium]
MRPTLFRQQALDHQRPALIGRELGVRPLSFPLLTGAAVALALAVILFGCFGQYTNKARVAGYLAPSTGLIKVFPSTTGTLIEKHVTEGQQVRRGDTLFVLSTEQASERAPQAQAAAIEQMHQRLLHARGEQEAQLQIDRSDAQSRRERLRSLELELSQIDAGITVQRARMEAAKAAAERYEELFERRLITRLQLEDAHANHLDQQSHIHEQERTRIALRREYEGLRNESQAAQFAAAKRLSELQRLTLSLSQEITESESRRIVVIAAPADGTVTAIVAERGVTVTPQSSLLAILPRDAELQARLLVPSRAIGSIALGDQVSLRYHAFASQRYGRFKGAIAEISRTLLAPAEFDGPIATKEPVYRVTVTLENRDVPTGRGSVPLQAGMQLDADIWLERRRLIEWLFEPLLGVARRV